MAAGDAGALERLFSEYSAIVNGIVRRILENPQDAAEAVQDAFIHAWRNAGSYRPERGEVVAWLVFIARNAAIDRVRRGARQRSLLEAVSHEPVDQQSALDRLDARDEIAWRLGSLSAPQQQALELAFFGGCTQEQIAAVMRTPVGNVKNHLRRGLQKLRRLAGRS